jgi:hypothetical protein
MSTGNTSFASTFAPYVRRVVCLNTLDITMHLTDWIGRPLRPTIRRATRRLLRLRRRKHILEPGFRLRLNPLRINRVDYRL